MARSRARNPSPGSAGELAFLLSQVGAHAAGRFAERLEPLQLKPAHAGILRVIRQADGLSQQALGETLGMFPSRLVAVLDELERYGLVERRDNPTDRRSFLLRLTPKGRSLAGRLQRELVALEREIARRVTGREQSGFDAVMAAVDAVTGVRVRER